MADVNGNPSKELISANERYAELGAIAVLVGLLLEVALAFKFRTYKSYLEEWGPLVADALIALGVYIEIHFGRKASNESAERVSEANDRASAAELAAEKLKAQFAWRRLSASAITLMSETLRNSERGELEITYFGSDPEATTFAHDVGLVFSQNGWTVNFVSGAYAGEVVFGLLIPMLRHADWDAARGLQSATRVVQSATSKAGIEFKDEAPPQPFMSQDEPGARVTYPCAHMYVGPKPMPKLQ